METDTLFTLLNTKYEIADQGLYLDGIDSDGYSECQDVTPDQTIEGLDRGALEWHTGTDFIYAINSCRIAGHGSRLWVYIEALALLEYCLVYQTDRFTKLTATFIATHGQENLDELYLDVELDQDLDRIDWSDDADSEEFVRDGKELLEADQTLSDLQSVCTTIAANLETLGVSLDVLRDAYVAGFERQP